MPSLVQTWAVPAAFLVIVNISTMWYSEVSDEVPDPYLDEFFHVPQAQRYCNGDYSWDPKITTPPGLYLVAKLFQPLIGCEINALRMLNVMALSLICPLSYGILRTIRSRSLAGSDSPKRVKVNAEALDGEDSTVLLDAHTALNVTLFPPLFFFAALFYTDIMSTLVVLLSYGALLQKKTIIGTFLGNITAVIMGIIALMFRQTNIFWVAIFPAGLAVIDALKRSAHPSKSVGEKTFGSIVQRSWHNGTVYDCSVKDAFLEDYILLFVTVILAALRRPILVIQVALPYLIVLGFFVAFVALNGGVVLGDKSAHTATVHIPQMLYVWPYIAFFSAPLLLQPLLQVVYPLLPKQFRAMVDKDVLVHKAFKLPSIQIAGIFVIIAFLAVHFNTIIHPYTLADNRHYVFYVFRILRLYPVLRYLLVPVYYVCAWLSIKALTAPPNDERALRKKHDDLRPTSVETGTGSPCQMSFIVIWLVTTTLSVVTAPLVEPRYFIIPWIIWRLHVQPSSASFLAKGRLATTSYDVRLGLETLWLLAIDATITYVFIHRGFIWPSEPGNVQRFLW